MSLRGSAQGAGQENARARSQAGGGHGSQEVGNALQHHRATGGSTWRDFGERGPHMVASPGTAAERSWLASPAVSRGGASLQVRECCGAGYPRVNPPPPAPGSTQQKGVLLLPTHLAAVSRSPPSLLPSPDPGTGGHIRCCPPRAGLTGGSPVCPREPRPASAPKHHGAQSSGQLQPQGQTPSPASPATVETPRMGRSQADGHPCCRAGRARRMSARKENTRLGRTRAGRM